jgi:putative intracellular protease/amidase
MSRPHDYIFVLWADKFEEATAAIFVTELRKVGLLVKVVGLTYQQTGGAYGLALAPDFTLEQALPLAANTSCLIIPCSLRIAKRLKNDPRLRDFIDQLRSNKAKFVIGQLNGADSLDLELFSLSLDDVTVYPASEELLEFARQMASLLSRAN